MYDPVTARFMQEDTFTGDRNDPLSLNLYTYCHNEPLMYSDPTGHKDYKPGESTAEYYMGVGSVGMYERPAWAYKSEPRWNWDKWDAVAQEIGNAELLTIMSDKAKLNSIVGRCRQTVILEAKETGEKLTGKQIDDRAEGDAIQEILMSRREDPATTAEFVGGLFTAMGSALLGEVAGAADANMRLILWIPAFLESGFGTHNVDNYMNNCFEAQDNALLSTGYVDEDAYNTGKPGGDLAYTLVTDYYAAKGIWDIIKYFQNPNTLKLIMDSFRLPKTTVADDAVNVVDDAVNVVGDTVNVVDDVANASARSAKSPVSGSEWNKYFSEQYGAENVAWETSVNAGEGEAAISNPLALPASTISNPWMEGTELISRQAPKDYFINMAKSSGQTKPGAWETVDTINDLNYARNNLAITPEFKGEISSVQKYLVPEGTWIQEGIAGPQTYKGIMYSGGANQTNILNFCDRSTLIPIGGRIPL